PSPTKRLAKSATRGVIPGISLMTMTAGPLPLRNTFRVLPSKVNSVGSKSSSESATGQTLLATLFGGIRLTGSPESGSCVWMRVIEGAPLPIHTWAPDLEEGAERQARNCAGLPVAFHHIAIMADGHPGYGVPIGAVLALQNAISPYAVGNDIGCGMAIVP